jgi:hypothetical protein
MAVTETETEQVVDLEALAKLEADATARLGELTEQRARLSLDALSDPRIATELDDVRSEIASCERALEQVALARTESGRRSAAAAAEADAKRREEALGRARVLQVEREAAAKAFDSAASAFAEAARWWLKTADDQDRALREAGRAPSASAPRMRAVALTAAYVHATRSLPRGVLQLEGAPPAPRDWQPLSTGDVRPVEPPEK